MGKQQKRIGSLQRAIDILNLFNGRTLELGVTEISRALEMPKSTVAGLVHTLEQNKFLNQHPQTKKYSLGYKLVERAGVFLEQMDLRRVAEPILEGLCDQANESVNFAIRDGNYVTYIARVQSDNMLRMRSEIGKRERIHSTALGKAILAFLSEKDLESFLEEYQLIKLTPKTITERGEFNSEIERTKNRGFAIDDQENETGGRCVASAVRNYQGEAIAAVSLSVPIQRFPDEKISEYGAMVLQAAEEISIQLGANVSREEG